MGRAASGEGSKERRQVSTIGSVNVCAIHQQHADLLQCKGLVTESEGIVLRQLSTWVKHFGGDDSKERLTFCLDACAFETERPGRIRRSSSLASGIFVHFATLKILRIVYN